MTNSVQSAFLDLSTEARANLTEPEIAGIVKLALMEAGVVAVPQPTPEPVPAFPSGRPVWSLVRSSSYDTARLGVFVDAEAAQKAAAAFDAALYAEHDYSGDANYTADATYAVRAERMMSKEDWSRHSETLKQGAKIKARNAAALKEWNDNAAKAAKIEDGIRAEHAEAVRMLAKLTEVRRVFAEYLDLAKDEAAARVFLKKAYPSELIEEALPEVRAANTTEPKA